MSTSTAPVTPQDVVRKIGDTNERALAYVKSPDPQLSRLPRGQRDALITDLPPVTAGALLGPAALARHFVASAASGRYRDLFALWELFRSEPDACRPVLADRPQALAKARDALRTAVALGLKGHADRVARDVREAEGLIWQWTKEVLDEHLAAVGARPAVASALLLREPEADVALPSQPDERWLAEAAAAAAEGELAPAVDERLAAGVDRLPATVATLQLAEARYPDRIDALLDRIDVSSPDAPAMLAWARHHGRAGRLEDRARAETEEAATRDRAEALARWRLWREHGIELPPPSGAKAHTLDGLDLTRPESAELLAILLGEGARLDVQGAVSALADENRQRAEKAFEALVCAGLDVELPKALEGNPIVKDGTRCPHCLAWTWVRPGHEERCPRRAASSTADAGTTPAEAPATADTAAIPDTGTTPAEAPATPDTAAIPDTGTTPAEAPATPDTGDDPDRQP